MLMVPGLDVIEELSLSFEIPYVTGKGEVIDSLTILINERRKGTYISYAFVDCQDQHLQDLFPSEGVDSLAQTTKLVLQDLGMKPRRIILQLWEYGTGTRSYSVESRAPVNKERDTVLIIFTKTPFIYKYGYELVLWHQAMHAKDRWEYRFPAAHPMVDAGEWLDVLWHLSIDGRLEGLGKPHYSKAERLEEAAKVLEGVRPGAETASRVRTLCDDIWGKEVTFSQLLDIGEGLGLKPDPGLWKSA